VPLLYVRGNHDGARGRGAEPQGDDLEGRLVRFRGLRLLGFEGSAWYGGKGIEYDERQMRWHTWRHYLALWLAGGVDIVISHAPPALTPEAAPAVELTEPLLRVGPLDDYKYYTSEPLPTDKAHRGFSSFNALIRTFRPRLWLHGHTHMNYSRAARVRRLGQTLVANAFEYLIVEMPERGAGQLEPGREGESAPGRGLPESPRR
jgi:Icc-related predicted phosphoesterase